jgi:hypothetical protein
MVVTAATVAAFWASDCAAEAASPCGLWLRIVASASHADQCTV